MFLLMACVSAQGQAPNELLIKAEALDNRLQADKALECYQQMEKLEPANASVLVCIARQYRHLMADAKSDGEKERLGRLALSYGQRAAALAPKDSDAQLSAAITYGKMLPLQGNKEQMECSKLIKSGADKAIRLNPRNDVAWHIAGRWHRGLAEIGTIKRALAALVYGKLPEATFEDAAACFEKAAQLNPNRVIHQIELGRTYAEMGRAAEAKRLIERGLAMPSVEKDDPEAKQRGRQTLAQLN